VVIVFPDAGTYSSSGPCFATHSVVFDVDGIPAEVLDLDRRFGALYVKVRFRLPVACLRPFRLCFGVTIALLRMLQLPTFEEVCNGTSGGYFPFGLANPATMTVETVLTADMAPYLAQPVSITSDSSASLNASYYSGNTVHCPPHCGGSLVSSPSTSGLYYYRPCTHYSSGDVCLDPPAGTVCGYGNGGDECQECPVGAVCPGGNRLWPRAGGVFFNVSVIVACATPERFCWDASLQGFGS
jgi:hypothetical protein